MEQVALPLQGVEVVDMVLRDWQPPPSAPAPAATAAEEATLFWGVDNGTLAVSNASLNCSNDYCLPDDEYLDLIETYVFPTTYEWLLIALHAAVFCIGLVGNALVCAAVYRNPGMRTVTNYFLVNLAVADFLVILLCLPPTVAWDVTETWFMGMALCKVVLYFQ
ncbi:hypothetical protein FOCC_FOCC014688, partial [Frankliniella occidentalis]|uniref:Orexin/Hypocretin receptor type 1-like n=1 Tax=Frankliniella occidentalis TaxID=133901 RepID=A0A9C6X695_FRAOC